MATGGQPKGEIAGAKQGVKVGDSERLRQIDRIVAWSFWTAKSLQPGTISRSWVAKFLKRSEAFVRNNWRNSPYSIDDNDGEQRALSQESKDIIRGILSRPKKKSVIEIVNEVSQARGKKKSYGTVYRFLKEEKARAFHIVTKPKMTEKSVINRLDFCEFLRDWDENDFLHLAPSDEFFVYAERKSNHQNDRIWSLSIDDIPENDRIRQKSKYPNASGSFLFSRQNG